jgi:hypothetical protein
MGFHLEWKSGCRPDGAALDDFETEDEALKYVVGLVKGARFAVPWLRVLEPGSVDQYKTIRMPANRSEASVGRVIETHLPNPVPGSTVGPPGKQLTP